MKTSWFRRFWSSLLGLRVLEEKRTVHWRVLITNTDAGPHERMFVVLLKGRDSESYPLLLTHDEAHAKAMQIRVEADLAALSPEAFITKYVHLPAP